MNFARNADFIPKVFPFLNHRCCRPSVVFHQRSPSTARSPSPPRSPAWEKKIAAFSVQSPEGDRNNVDWVCERSNRNSISSSGSRSSKNEVIQGNYPIDLLLFVFYLQLRTIVKVNAQIS